MIILNNYYRDSVGVTPGTSIPPGRGEEDLVDGTRSGVMPFRRHKIWCDASAVARDLGSPLYRGDRPDPPGYGSGFVWPNMA